MRKHYSKIVLSIVLVSVAAGLTGCAALEQQAALGPINEAVTFKADGTPVTVTAGLNTNGISFGGTVSLVK